MVPYILLPGINTRGRVSLLVCGLHLVSLFQGQARGGSARMSLPRVGYQRAGHGTLRALSPACLAHSGGSQGCTLSCRWRSQYSKELAHLAKRLQRLEACSQRLSEVKNVSDHHPLPSSLDLTAAQSTKEGNLVRYADLDPSS